MQVQSEQPWGIPINTREQMCVLSRKSHCLMTLCETNNRYLPSNLEDAPRSVRRSLCTRTMKVQPPVALLFGGGLCHVQDSGH
jgi:hypothetical protein